jgi:hypothetical protein
MVLSVTRGEWRATAVGDCKTRETLQVFCNTVWGETW